MSILRNYIDFLIPIIMIILGGTYVINPPDRINEHCGFRSERSMKSSKAWLFANTNLGKLWVIFGIISISLIFLLKTLFNLTPEIISLVGLTFSVISMLASLAIVEEELKIKFKN
ncbi:SdpI family protein [Clostridium sp.]|uniref:SdpI family protein n=1 Tax=Clostridium sp. TaxID=1506 RepID=UPI002FCA0026